jgi:hypothetical protein
MLQESWFFKWGIYGFWKRDLRWRFFRCGLRLAMVNSAGIDVVLLISQKDYEHFNTVWGEKAGRESVGLWSYAFAQCFGER